MSDSLRKTPFSAGNRELIEQVWQANIFHRVEISARCSTECAGQKSLTRARRTEQDDVSLFQNVFAYVVTLIVYQIGSFAMGGAFTVGTAVGIVFLLIMLFLLFRPDPYKDQKVYSKRSVQA